jgi:hypothetical protein
MPLDGSPFAAPPVVTEIPSVFVPEPGAAPLHTASLEEMVGQPGTEVTITAGDGSSLIGTQITTNNLWQRWNLTMTNTTSSTSNVIQLHPESVTQDTTTGTTEIVWRQWNDQLVTGSVTNGSIDLSITTASNALTNTITTASSSSTITYNHTPVWNAWNRPAPHVWQQMDAGERAAHEEAERTAYEERQAQNRAQREEDRRNRTEAAEKAEKLLMTCLTAEQQMQWRTRKCFYVTTRSGRRYRFDSNTYQGNVKLVEQRMGGDDLVLSSFCIHLPHHIPLCDHLLAQKLMLEADEPTFMRIANEALRDGAERVSDLILAAA